MQHNKLQRDSSKTFLETISHLRRRDGVAGHPPAGETGKETARERERIDRRREGKSGTGDECIKTRQESLPSCPDLRGRRRIYRAMHRGSPATKLKSCRGREGARPGERNVK